MFLKDSKTRLDYIDKETDTESNLGDYGVRKYDSFTGRFITPDVLFEKYAGWSPYHYSLDNPVSYLDGNGYWALEISKAEHRENVHNINRNKNGYIASKINYEFYNNWKSNAPAVANFVANNDLFVMQSNLGPNVYGESELSGNLSWYDLNKKNSYNLLEGATLHEVVHQMGYNEFGAWSAMLSAGYISENEMKYKLELGDYFYYLNGNDDLRLKYRDKKITTEEVIEKMQKNGSIILGTSK